MGKRIIDLHIHTTCSDGALTPFEIIDKAKENNVSTIAIADHDTVMAYTDELFEYAHKNGITLIPAVEISTKIGKVGVHILGYNIDIKNAELLQNLDALRNSRHNYLCDVSNLLSQLGYKVNLDKLDTIDAVTKAHIALDIVSNEENKELLLKNFGHIPSKGEFIETIMNEGCPAYTLKKTITPMTASELIRSAGGKVVIAHPVAYGYEDNFQLEDVIDLIGKVKPDGLEANYIYVDRHDNVIDECDKWNKVASEYGLFTTIGSDYHCTDGLHPEIGLVNTSLQLSESSIENILSNLNS